MHSAAALPRRLAAGLMTVALVGLGMLAAPAAHAAEAPATTAAIASVTDSELTIHVSGTNYVNLPKTSTGKDAVGSYVAVIDRTRVDYDVMNANTTDATLAIAFLPFASRPGQPWAITDGAYSTDLTIPLDELDDDTVLEVLAWSSHGDFTDSTAIFRQQFGLVDDQWAALGAGENLAPATAPTDEDAQTDEAEGTTESSAKNKAEKTTKKTSDNKTSNKKTSNNKTPGKKAQKKSTNKPTDDANTVQCTVEDVPANLGTPRLAWGVKSSFLGYIDSNLADGTVAAGGGAVWNGSTVTWGTGSGNLASDGTGTLTFPGTLHISGHGGVLDLTFSNLTVRSTGGSKGVLSATVASSDMEGNPVSASGNIATVAFSSIGRTGGTGTATLTANGAKAFAGFYSAGQALDSLTITFAGSSPATTVKNCVDADGNLVSEDGTPISGLAATGVNTGQLMLIALALLATGLALVVADRRRATSR